MATTYPLEVVTPERVLLSESVTMTIAPGSEGQLGILAHHMPLMTELAPGEVLATLADGRTTSHIVISGGFLEIAAGDGRTTILADSAERVDEIDISRAESDLPLRGKCWRMPVMEPRSRSKRGAASPIMKSVFAPRAASHNLASQNIKWFVPTKTFDEGNEFFWHRKIMASSRRTVLRE